MNTTGFFSPIPPTNVIDAAKALIAKGYTVTPVVAGSKVPKLKDWPNKQIPASEVDQHFTPDDNLAIILGDKSGGLVDIDFDHPTAKKFANLLPETAMVHGRPGNPVSHYWYLIDTPTKSKKFSAPDGTMLIELRSNGCITMAPPSKHPDGDQLLWVQHGQPALVTADSLAIAAGKIAAATLLAIYWPAKGSRNSAALALAGGLLRAGWDVPTATTFIREVAKAADDSEYESRGACAEATASKLHADEEVTGLPTLSTLIGTDIVSRVADWLNLELNSGHSVQIDAVVEKLNTMHAVVNIGGGTWILNEVIDSATKLPDVSFSKKGDFQLRYESRRILTESGKPITYADAWLQHPKRRQFEGIEFAPESPQPGFYNLFRGFAVEAAAGDCSLYLAHILDNICRGDKNLYTFVISWMAHAVQRPGELPGTALVLRGAQGVGKGVFVDNFGKLFGSHFLTVYRLSQITGRFNGHLKNLLVVHANEAVWGGHKEAEGALKGLVTDPMIPIEAKGKDITQVRNYKRLICSSNEQWAVPLDLDDRRFLILDVAPTHKEDHEYFGAIEQQMQNGGLGALMYHLATQDLTGFNVRKLPVTSMAFDLKLLSASATANWWYEELMDAHSLCGSEVPKSLVYKLYQDWCHDHKKAHYSTLPIFAKELKKLVPTLTTVKHKASTVSAPTEKQERPSFFKFPPRDECRKHFEVLTKSGPEIWED